MVASALFCVIFVVQAHSLSAEEKEQADKSLSYILRSLLFFDASYPAHSTQNPENSFLRLPRYSAELDLRPDFFLETPYTSAVFKPRATSSHQWWEDGVIKGENGGRSRAYVNEWRVQVRPYSTVFFSYGKEKLLWGSSFLSGPSNILFKDTEKANPKTEVEGKYLARLVYLPNNALTFTAISETQKDDGMPQVNDKPIRALKAELMGSDYLLAVIGYHKQDDRFRLGTYGQWTASDALVLYYDGIVTKGSDALYPEENQSLPLDGEFVKKYDNSSKLFTTVTAGGSYTFLSGSTLSMEFLYNGEGYGDAEAREYYRLRQDAANHFFDGGTMSASAAKTLSESLNTGSPFLRRYYLMAQFQNKEIKNVLDIIFRYVHSIEENAGMASTIIEWKLTDNLQFFNLNTVSVGHGRDTDYNSILAKSFMAGIEVHF